jgi:hypothetical protein
MSTANQEGEYYFCVGMSSKKDIYVFAAGAEVVDGAIVLRKKDGQMSFTLASGQWEYCYAASSVDGSPIAVEHWIQDRRSVPPKKRLV